MPVPKVRQAPIVGATYEKKYKGVTHELVVVKTEEGIGYRVKSKVYSSPTAAAVSITGISVNGWRFWGMDPQQK